MSLNFFKIPLSLFFIASFAVGSNRFPFLNSVLIIATGLVADAAENLCSKSKVSLVNTCID